MQKANLAVYGTLRRNEYNYYGATGIEVKDPVRKSGYKMYSVGGGFPAVVKTGNDKDSVVFEPQVYRLESEEDYNNMASIDRMEIGAGYYIDVVEINGEYYKVYLYSPESAEGLSEVEGGDWVKRDKSVRFV
jgi:gamma-glutamylcyclotransferase (GGCT)/AIG2-like uncharacterized protein YtfP